MSQLYSLSVERHALAALYQNPDLFPEITFISEKDFYNPIHKLLYASISQSILNKETPNTALITGRLSQNGITTFDENVSIADYLESTSKIKVARDSFISFFKELAHYRIKRDLIDVGTKIINQAKGNSPGGIKDLVASVDSIYSDGVNRSVLVDSHDGPREIFSMMEPTIEDLGENPPDINSLLGGPLPTLNRLFGTLNKRGAVNCIAARSGVGKTSFNLFYHVWMAETYNIPILWMDFGEMSPEELIVRAAACMTNGEVPLYDIEYGTWRKNKRYVELIRNVWPRAKKIKFYYVDVSDKTETEIISIARRYQYNIVGRGNPFFWVFDYLKPFDSGDFSTPEWKQMGSFIKNVKNFVKGDAGDINTCFNTSLQVNRSGITTNKFSKDVDDSENSFGVSDRIQQQCSLAFIIRNKTQDELQQESGQYGNLKMINVKRRYLGKDAMDILTPVTLPDGRMVSNYINLKSRNFFFEDLGDLKQMIKESADIFSTPEDPHSHSNPL